MKQKTKTHYFNPIEHEEQVRLINWADTIAVKRWPKYQIPFPGERKKKDPPFIFPLFAIPNGRDRHLFVALKLKKEGVRSGVLDLFLPIPIFNHAGLFIEMKRRKGGSLSRGQKVWISFFKSQAYKVEVCNGCDEAISAIESYLDSVHNGFTF